MSWLLRTPKGQLLLIFGGLLVLAGGTSNWRNLAAAVVTACLIDGACMWLELGRPRLPTSALLSALIVFFILSPSESWLVVAWTSGFAIAAKRLVRVRREHIFNPAAALFLAFFMLTDLPTSPNRYVDQVWYGLLAAGGAVAAQLLGAGQTYLLVGTLVANLGLAGVRAWRRQAAPLLARDPA